MSNELETVVMPQTRTCNNCGGIITCGCQYATATDGVQVCDECVEDYERMIGMRSFISNVRNYVKEHNAEDKYCVLFYTFIGDKQNAQNIQIKYIYKNIDDFESKVVNHIRQVDSFYGIDFQIWLFD